MPCFLPSPAGDAHERSDPTGRPGRLPLNINLTDFIDEFGDELLESLNRSNPRSIPAPTTLTASW